MKCEKCNTLKTILIVVGAIVTVGALVYAAYSIFKKYFQITFECDGDCSSCDDCFGEEENFEPICCCEEEPCDCDCDCGCDSKEDEE